MIDRERLFRYSRGIIEMKERHHETELLAGPERGLLLNLAQQMLLYLLGILLQFVVGIGVATLSWVSLSTSE